MVEELMVDEEMMEADGEDTPESCIDPALRNETLRNKSQGPIRKFLGGGPYSIAVYTTRWYYGDILAWTLNCITASPGWKIVSVGRYSYREPVYRDIQTDYTQSESCLIDGQVLVEKENIRLVITIRALQRGSNFIQVEATETHHELVKKIVQEMADF